MATIRREPFGIVFHAPGTFAALHEAQAFLRNAGFSLGSLQCGAPTAAMFGDYDISKWRNLSRDERREVHATLTGDGREGPLTFRFLPAAPDAAITAIEGALTEQVQA